MTEFMFVASLVIAVLGSVLAFGGLVAIIAKTASRSERSVPEDLMTLSSIGFSLVVIRDLVAVMVRPGPRSGLKSELKLFGVGLVLLVLGVVMLLVV